MVSNKIYVPALNDFASRRCIEHFVLGPKMNAVDLAGLDL